ncbi:GNAT family N-acetyltransferase [Peribacillus frigoritolerans]|uniref:GNAT family N-acetyltransferase n=1 Tax=Peribacillus frigoritolerans TaxID=450367 RepID=UPI00105A7851|nr:GNAT family protein [Peribacillus frigoritolerans]TDL82405.1 N-acetyltransferase [Peribacillus frigoritolerans]
MEIRNSTITGESIFLREMRQEDWAGVHQYASQERACAFQPWGPNTEEETKAFVRQVVEDSRKDPRTRYSFAIINKKEKKMIGAAELNISDWENRAGEISYIVNPDYWGKGVASEAAGLLIALGFKEFHLHRIFATCDPENTGSFRVMEKAGMKKEGRIRHHLKLKDGWRDSLLYSVLENEWSE